MDYFIKTKTPIWTGGIEGICDTIHETGIIGSMRWWYEVVLRGLDVFACDPTSAEQRCPNEITIGNQKQKKWCNACDLFGMTGQQRKFKINMSDGKPVFVQHDKNKDVINIMPQKSDPPRSHGWYLGAGRIAQNQNGLILQIMPLSKKDRDATDEKIKLLLCLISRWAGIGAKQQHGYGIFDIYEKINTENKRLEIDENEFDAMIQKLKNPPERPRNEVPGDTLPSLKNFFFAKVRLDGLSGGWQNSVDGAQTALNDADQKARFGSWHTQHDSRIFAPALKNQLRYVVFNGHTPVQKELFGDISVKKGAKAIVFGTDIAKSSSALTLSKRIVI